MADSPHENHSERVGRSGEASTAGPGARTIGTNQFATFLDTMKEPKAADLVRSIRTFIRTFESQQPPGVSSRGRSSRASRSVELQEKNGLLVQ